MKILFALLLVPFLLIPVYAETQTSPTDRGTLHVRLVHDTIEFNVPTKITLDFINPNTQKVQEHIDYTVAVSKDGETVFGPIPLTHTSLGTVKIPIEFNRAGNYTMDIVVEGILFQPIPKEKVSFDIKVREASVRSLPVTAPSVSAQGTIEPPTSKTIIDVKTDKTSYNKGETVRIYGKVSEIIPEASVAIVVSSPNDNLVSISSLQVNGNGQFSDEFTIGSVLSSLPGAYTVKAIYDSEEHTATTTFNLNTTVPKNTIQDAIIPNWVKTIFAGYANNQITDAELIDALEFLIKSKIIVIP